MARPALFCPGRPERESRYHSTSAKNGPLDAGVEQFLERPGAGPLDEVPFELGDDAWRRRRRTGMNGICRECGDNGKRSRQGLHRNSPSVSVNVIECLGLLPRNPDPSKWRALFREWQGLEACPFHAVLGAPDSRTRTEWLLSEEFSFAIEKIDIPDGIAFHADSEWIRGHLQVTMIREDRDALAGAGADPDAEFGVRRRRIGIAMVVLAGVFWSLQGPAVRFIEAANGPQIIFWRSIGQLVVMLGVTAVVSRGRVLSAFRLAGYRAVVGALFHTAAGTCFVLAVLHTTVANVVFIMASAPLVAAAGAWLLLRERVEPRTLGAMVAAVMGIAVMMSEGLATGNVAGMLLALVTTIGFAGIAVVARWGGGLNMLPAVCLGAALTIVTGWAMAGGDVTVTFSDRLFALASGGLLTAAGATLFLYGAKFVPAGVLVFLTLTEVVLAPIWVWTVFDEVPSAFTLAGGAVVLGAICIEAVLRVRHVERP